MKRVFSFLLILFLLSSTWARAEPAPAPTPSGDPNVDGGGSGTGSGTEESFWSGGNDGVRVTILRDGVKLAALDLSNKDWAGEVDRGFTKRCKLEYKANPTLVPAALYTNWMPPVTMPRIVSTTGASTIDTIKSYFTDRQVVEYIASKAGLSSDTLTGEGYKLMLEPMAYFKYKGVDYAMTATEAALFDVEVDGQLRYWMGTLTHQNLPFAMFLERSDLGLLPWEGATSGKQSNINILNQLGVGIVTFKPMPDELPETSIGDYNYTTDTDVITAISVRNDSEVDLTPDSNAYVTFTIAGKTYQKQFVCPRKGSQLVWVQWHTPTTPQEIRINVFCRPADYDQYVTAVVSDIPSREPPDPVFDGPGVGAGQYIPNFRLSRQPQWDSQTTTSWSEWYPVWVPPNFIPTPGGGYTIPGHWRFEVAQYSASLNVDYKLVPNDRVPTEFRLAGNRYEMKSGYGVDVECSVQVTGSPGTSNYDITPIQSGVALFPEFYFKEYNRLLEPESRGSYRTTMTLPVNEFSYYGCRTHFTPLWYPDDMDYPVPVAVFGAWTPGGQLYAAATDSIHIAGGAVLDDWYIRRL